jgi:predicted CXXCH cytochrome family protein
MGTKPWLANPSISVAENGCGNCHQTHGAPHPQRLLTNAQEPRVCLNCHNGSVARKYLEGEFFKFSAHPIFSTNWVHDEKEGSNTMERHVACSDCHNPHQAFAAPTRPPMVPGPLEGVSGINISGGTISKANYEYEVCLKCHGIRDQTTSGFVRQDNVRNVRLEINPSNRSFHPVATTGRNTTLRGFEAGYSTASIISCTDCHNNDAWRRGGTQPRGSHGSQYAPILAANYQVNDPATESFQSYAICYQCHNRNALIHDSPGSFKDGDISLHQLHVVDQRTPCAVCHDAHGSRQNLALINFMLRDETGRTVVSPSTKNKRISFESTGPGQGRCFLRCHGTNHDPTPYGP